MRSPVTHYIMQNPNGRMSPSEIKAQLQASDTTLLEMLKFVFSHVLHRRGLLLLNVFLLTIIAGLNFLIPQYTKNIVDHALIDQQVGTLFTQISYLLLTTIVLGCLNFISTYMMQILSQRAITALRLQTYERILRQDYAYFQNAKTGDLMVRLTNDIGNLQMLISSDSFGIIGNLFTFFAVLGFLYAQNWQLAALVSLTFPILFITIRFFRGHIREAYSKVRATSSLISNQLQATLTEIELIKSYTTERLETQAFEKVVEQSNTHSLEATRWQAIFTPLMTLINTAGTAIVLGFGGLLVIDGKLSVGDLVAYLSYLALLQNPINAFSRLINTFQTAQVSYDRVKEILQVTPTIVDNPAGQPFPSPLQQGITLENVSFHYDDHTIDALHELSFHIPAGQTTALVGRSGSGKSTLIRLLTRLYEPTAGRITFDGIDMTDIQLAQLRQNISLVSQEVTIVDGTIADNIRYGQPDASDDALWHAAQQADIADFIKSLPNGMQTAVGERGIKLSGGQKQRLSIARALLKDAPIVILDEATAALDNASERAIQRALDNLMVAKTAIVIAHRLTTVHHADQIVVLDNGHVQEIGTHTTLLAKDGPYKMLYDAQFD
jgi:subfamily B ATP-binding cassette protein MsbA